MKRILFTMLIVLATTSARAETIEAIQTGLVPEHTAVEILDVVVVAARDIGVYVSEAPYGGYNGIWVYTGGAPAAAVGDVVQIQGEYYEYYEVSEIDATAGSVQVVGSMPVPEPTIVEFDYSSTANLLVQVEMYESCLIKQVLNLTVTDLPDAHGEWWAWTDPALAGTEDADAMLYDDFWYDTSTVQLGDVYCAVTGILHYSFGLWKLEPLADGIEFCPAVADEKVTFGDIKALYR